MLGAITWSWVDLAFVLFSVLSVCLGLWRGVVFELMSLLGWVVAFIAAQTLQAWAQPLVPFGQPGSGLNNGLAFAAVFFGTLVVWGLGARLIRMLIHATPLSSLDRLFGAAFGLLRGMLVLLVLVVVVEHTPAAKSTAWSQSQAATWINGVAEQLRPWLRSTTSSA
jgi:membrane protein required for colicin V production